MTTISVVLHSELSHLTQLFKKEIEITLIYGFLQKHTLQLNLGHHGRSVGLFVTIKKRVFLFYLFSTFRTSLLSSEVV